MTLFRAVLTPFLFFCDVNYLTSLQMPMLHEGTSFLLLRNVKKTRNKLVNARYILNKKCTNMHENEDADKLCGNSVTYQRL